MKSLKIKNMTYIALMAALLCVTGPLTIPIPFSPVPISVANFIIYICTIIIGLKKGTMSVLIYYLIGAVGLPVFSGFTGGLSKFVGPTGGYLIGFLFMALSTGIFVNKFKGKVYMYAVGMIIGTLICYFIGTLWLSYLTQMGLKASLLTGVIPFIPGDILKIIISCIIGDKIRKSVDKI